MSYFIIIKKKKCKDYIIFDKQIFSLQLKTAKGSIPLKESNITDNPIDTVEKDLQCVQASCMKAASLKGMV